MNITTHLQMLAESEERRLHQRFPAEVRRLNTAITLTENEGTWWVRDARHGHEDEPFGTKAEADEARKARVLDALMQLERSTGQPR